MTKRGKIMPEIGRLPCPNVEGCGSSDAYSYNTDEGIGHCKSCDDWSFAIDKVVKRKSNRSDEEMAFDVEIPEIKDYEYIAARGISSSVMEMYDVRSYKNAAGDVVKQEYVYPSGGKKIRVLPKTFSAKNLSQDELFGMNIFPAGCARMVTITEGEIDALSVQEIMGGKSITPVVSLPSATPSKRLWEKCTPWLDSFEKIVLSVDNDAAGNAVAAKIFNMFPNKTYRVIHDVYKDANDFLTNNARKEFSNAWWNANKYTPENILNTSDQFVKLFKESPEYNYVPTGIEALDDKIMGLMQGHFTVIKAPTGIGKTEVMRYLEYNMIKRGVPFASWHLEETKLRSLLGLVSYHLNQNLTRRDIIDALGVHDLVEDAIRDLTKDELIYQFYMPDGGNTDDFIEQIRYLSQGCECKYIFFEPIQDVVVGSSEESKEQQLADLSVRLSKLAAELNVGIVTIAHTNENGDPKYCKMIGQRASVIIDLYRDKLSEDDHERNTTQLRVEKNRPCSEEGMAGTLLFDSHSFTLEETHS
jgi:twinkle protein